MPKYKYTAINKEGKKENSIIEAAGTMAAGHLLKEQGLIPLEIHEIKDNPLMLWLRSLGTIPLKQKIVFIENLHIMIKAGIAAPRALKIIAKQTRNRKFQNILNEIAHQVESGKNLHESLEVYPNVFSHIIVSMVKVGELSGNLEKSLEYLSIQLEREADLRSKTKGAMIYPAVIVTTMVLIGLLMAIYVLPKLTSIFKDFNAELPFTTRLVIIISDFMSSHSIIVLGGLVGAVIGVGLFLKTLVGARALDAILLYFPLINSIIKKINLARFSRVLSSMLKSGIPIVEGLQVSAESLGNVYYRELIIQAATSVRVGKPLTEALATNERLFPYLVVQMLEVGEETGSLENMLQQLAEHFEAEVDNTMRNLSSIIEPLLLLCIGGVVGFLALALIAPIYNIGQNIG